jgi:two-component system, OmpR family, phosphate regulon sensor histidine kinase PhoR
MAEGTVGERIATASDGNQKRGEVGMKEWLKHLRWRAAYGYLLAIAAIMAGFTIYLTLLTGSTLRAIIEARMVEEVRNLALSPQLQARWEAGEGALAPALTDAAVLLGVHTTAFDNQGRQIASSHALESQRSTMVAPEVRMALSSGLGISRRTEGEPGEAVTYVAVAVGSGEGLDGVVRAAFPSAAIESAISQAQQRVIFACLLATLLVVGGTFLVIERRTLAMRRLRGVVERNLAGDNDARLLSYGNREEGDLALAVNRIADKLRSQMKKRARERDRLNTVLHVMTDGVIILNRAGNVRQINPAAARLLHTTPEKALNRTFVQAARDHRIAEVWNRCQQSGTEESAAIELNLTQFVRVVVTPLLRHGARGYLVMLQDLTQIRRLQTIRQDFVSNVSHELRTPLASLHALVDTLRDGALEDPPAAARFLDRMDVEVDALTQMVEELLELSRIESGQVPLRMRPATVQEVVAVPAERLRPQAERARIELTVTLDESLPEVLVDVERIHQVVTNLVHNAIKFTPVGGQVSVSGSASESEVVISVTDTGIGIAEGDLSRIFERFYKTDRSRAVGGTGLGLAISKHIVQAHAGRIWAESREGKGSTFYFSLPTTAAGMAAPLPEVRDNRSQWRAESGT